MPQTAAPQYQQPQTPNQKPQTPMQLIFATNNAHKVEEIQSAIGGSLEVISLRQAGIDIDIPEPHDTLEANASEKSATIHRLTGMDCFSEDTGLEVTALGGEPGVKSARYAGEDRAFAANIEKLLGKLGDNPDRRARFRTVISLLIKGSEHLFEGICEGTHPRQRPREQAALVMTPSSYQRATHAALPK